jgi:putative transposase
LKSPFRKSPFRALPLALVIGKRRSNRHLQQARPENILTRMRIVDPKTGRSYVEKRRVRNDEPGQPRERTFSCYRHHAFLGRDRTRQWLCEARTEFGFQLWAYVWMPEHVPVLAYPGDAAPLMSRFQQAVKEPVARQAIGYLKSNSPEWLARVTVREGPRQRHRFWQPGGGYDRYITSARALRAVIAYIHANPVHRGLVARAEDWEWSSARCYAGLRPTKLQMDQEEFGKLPRG